MGKAGFGRVRFFNSRHTRARQLVRARVNIEVVSQRLGHASIRITLDTHRHALLDMQQETAAEVDALIRRASSSV